MQKQIIRKRGPVPGPPTQQYTVWLEPEDGEWGKGQPGGLSELLRCLLKRERDFQQERDKQTDQQPADPQD